MSNGISQLENRDWRFKQDIEIVGNVRRSPSRYYLEEFFSHTPGVNGDLASATEATRVPRNKHFEVLGTNAVSGSVTFSATEAGNVLTTAGADNDQVIILPHLDTGQTSWTGTKWGTENSVVWECAIRTGSSVAAVLIWAGLKLTNDPTIATDDDQVFFRFSTDDSDTTWHVIDSIGGTDVNTSTSVTVAASTTYRLRIEIDSDRKASFFINDTQVHRTAALTNDVDFIPYVGVQALAAAAKTITLGYEKISRDLFE